MGSNPRRGNPELIITRTPLRISFAGGGTDLPEFYSRESGAVLSTAIDKFVYVTVKRHTLFGENYRLNYSDTEHVDRLDDIKNDIARECLRFIDVEPPVYISTIADLPAFSGLGSSSSFAVGLLNALHAFKGERVSAGQLAEEGCHIELDVLGRPIGKQDQYAAAFGGLNFFCFPSDGGITVEPQVMSDGGLDRLFDHLMVFWTGVQRDADSVLEEQNHNTEANVLSLLEMRAHAEQLRALVRNDFEPASFGRVLDATWRLKRQLASSVSNRKIDEWYERSMDADAYGGKILGAGGGGFMLLVVAPEKRPAVREVLADLSEIDVRYEAQGSRLLLPSVG